MKKVIIGLVMVCAIVLAACGDKPATKNISADLVLSDTTLYPRNLPYEFTVNHTKFRIELVKNNPLPNTNYLRFSIEKFVAEHWNNMDTVIAFVSDSDGILLKDINEDGAWDMDFSEGGSAHDVYFFNPDKNAYVFVSDSASFGNDIVLIDKEKSIYCDMDDEMTGASRLFQIKDYARYNLGYIRTEWIEFVPYTAIYKITSGYDHLLDNDQTVWKGKANMDTHDEHKNTFDYAGYWKKNWQKFLP